MNTQDYPLIPILFYPLKVLFVDDNNDVLASYKDNFTDKFPMAVTNSPITALSMLQKNNYPQLLLQNICESQPTTIDEGEQEHLQNLLNVVNRIAKDPSKYNNYQILITDYDMPEINGIDLCNKFSNTPVIKILLTGKYDLSSAMKARNNNVIDCYINKGDNDTIEQINDYVVRLTYKYFVTLTDRILSIVRPSKLDFLFDINFAELINSKIKELDITEYYMLNESGSFFLSNNHKKYALIVYNNDALNEFCEMFENEPIVKGLVAYVKKRKLIPFFGINKYPENIPLNDWENMFCNANKHFDYFWNLIQI